MLIRLLVTRGASQKHEKKETDDCEVQERGPQAHASAADVRCPSVRKLQSRDPLLLVPNLQLARNAHTSSCS